MGPDPLQLSHKIRPAFFRGEQKILHITPACFLQFFLHGFHDPDRDKFSVYLLVFCRFASVSDDPGPADVHGFFLLADLVQRYADGSLAVVKINQRHIGQLLFFHEFLSRFTAFFRNPVCLRERRMTVEDRNSRAGRPGRVLRLVLGELLQISYGHITGISGIAYESNLISRVYDKTPFLIGRLFQHPVHLFNSRVDIMLLYIFGKFSQSPYAGFIGGISLSVRPFRSVQTFFHLSAHIVSVNINNGQKTFLSLLSDQLVQKPVAFDDAVPSASSHDLFIFSVFPAAFIADLLIPACDLLFYGQRHGIMIIHLHDGQGIDRMEHTLLLLSLPMLFVQLFLIRRIVVKINPLYICGKHPQGIRFFQHLPIKALVDCSVYLCIFIQHKEIAAAVVHNFSDIPLFQMTSESLAGKACRIRLLFITEQTLPGAFFCRRVQVRVKAFSDDIRRSDDLFHLIAFVYIVLFAPNVIHCQNILILHFLSYPSFFSRRNPNPVCYLAAASATFIASSFVSAAHRKPLW